MNSPKDEIIVDVDSTMFDFQTPLFIKARVLAPDYPPPSMVETWDTGKELLTPKAFYGLVNQIHEEQPIYKPFPYTGWLTRLFMELGYRVIVASHRKKEYREGLQVWLNLNMIPYHDLFVEQEGKDRLITEKTFMVVDDCPATMKTAVFRGVPNVWSLAYAYNKGIPGTTLFPSIKNMLEFTMKNIRRLTVDIEKC